MPGTLNGEGAVSNWTSLGKIPRPFASSEANQVGVGLLRKAARRTLFCGFANIKLLWTTPFPDWSVVDGMAGEGAPCGHSKHKAGTLPSN